LPALFNALQINNCLKITSARKLRTIFGSHHVPTTKSTLYVVSKDEWDTKEGPGKSMKNALYVQQYGKRHLLASNSENIKPIALSIVELCESEGISQSDRQFVSLVSQ